jgi:transposase
MSQHGGGIVGHHCPEASPLAQQISGLGLDIATLVCHVVGMADTRHVVFRKRLAHREWRYVLAKLSPLRMGMEAYGSTHGWARRFRGDGHEVRLIVPPFPKQVLYRPSV